MPALIIFDNDLIVFTCLFVAAVALVLLCKKY